MEINRFLTQSLLYLQKRKSCVVLRLSSMGNIFFQLVAQQCCTTSLYTYCHPCCKLRQHDVRNRQEFNFLQHVATTYNVGGNTRTQRFSTCNETMSWDKLEENVARITRSLVPHNECVLIKAKSLLQHENFCPEENLNFVIVKSRISAKFFKIEEFL